MGLFKALFGGSSQKSEHRSQSTSRSQSRSNSRSGNLFSDELFLGLIDRAASAGQPTGTSQILDSLLGTGDPELGRAGFERYKDTGGFDFLQSRGFGDITAKGAASGLLRSGGTQKDLVQFSSGLSSQFLNQYISQLLGYNRQDADIGLKAADIIRGAGQYSRSESASDAFSNSSSYSTGRGSSSPGIADRLGAAFTAIAASDVRLKNIIRKVDELPNGLNVYEFEYKGQPGQIHRGVIAQEVKKIMPEAIGPTMGGYMTVDYDKIWGVTAQ